MTPSFSVPPGWADPLPRRHDLIVWPGYDLFQLEVAGDDGDLELVALRIAGRIVTEVVKDEVWEDAEDCVRELNAGFAASACADRADRAGKLRREMAG